MCSGTNSYLGATDKFVGTKTISYMLNNQPEMLYPQPIKFTNKGLYTLKIETVDYLENQNVSEVIEFVIR